MWVKLVFRAIILAKILVTITFQHWEEILHRKKIKKRFLQIWNLAGQSDYQKLRASYFVSANGVVIVFDITNPDSPLSINYWINEVETNLDSKVPIFIFANKIDLRTDEEHYIVEENAKEVILHALFSYGANYLCFETSAKTGETLIYCLRICWTRFSQLNLKLLDE